MTESTRCMSTDLKPTSPLADKIACLALLLLLLVADMPLLAISFMLLVTTLPQAPSLTILLTPPPTMFKQSCLVEQACAPSTHPPLTKQQQRGSRKSYVTCYNIRSRRDYRRRRFDRTAVGHGFSQHKSIRPRRWII